MTPPIRPKHRPLDPGGTVAEKSPAAAKPHFEHPLARVPAAELNVARRRAWRRYVGLAFEYACMASTWTGLIVVTILLVGVVWQAAGRLDWSFLANYDSRHPDQAGIRAGLAGSIWLVSLTALFAVPIGVGAAVYLEEYANDNWFTRLIRLNLSNLAGVPSIVYGILGLTVFVRMFGLFGRDGKTLELLGFLEIPLPLVARSWRAR
jgi:phosphate transport system permease protein